MIVSLIKTSTRLLIFGSALLLGIQVPAFVGQYSLRVDAHFQEVSANIAGFQQTADTLFAGNLDALVNYYRESDDEVFRSDAQSVQTIVDRYRRFSLEQQAMRGNPIAAAWHVLTAADSELMLETRTRYTYTVPLDGLALQWGAAIALLVLLLCEFCVVGCGKCVGMLRNKKAPEVSG